MSYRCSLNNLRQANPYLQITGPEYETSGPIHDPTWTSRYYTSGSEIGRGMGRNKVEAAEAAARQVVELWQNGKGAGFCGISPSSGGLVTPKYFLQRPVTERISWLLNKSPQITVVHGDSSPITDLSALPANMNAETGSGCPSNSDASPKPVLSAQRIVMAQPAFKHAASNFQTIGSALSSHGIPTGVYMVRVGFDEEFLQFGHGILQEIYIFTDFNVVHGSKLLLHELGKICYPFPSIWFTPSQIHYLPLLPDTGAPLGEQDTWAMLKDRGVFSRYFKSSEALSSYAFDKVDTNTLSVSNLGTGRQATGFNSAAADQDVKAKDILHHGYPLGGRRNTLPSGINTHGRNEDGGSNGNNSETRSTSEGNQSARPSDVGRDRGGGNDEFDNENSPQKSWTNNSQHGNGGHISSGGGGGDPDPSGSTSQRRRRPDATLSVPVNAVVHVKWDHDQSLTRQTFSTAGSLLQVAIRGDGESTDSGTSAYPGPLFEAICSPLSITTNADAESHVRYNLHLARYRTIGTPSPSEPRPWIINFQPHTSAAEDNVVKINTEKNASYRVDAALAASPSLKLGMTRGAKSGIEKSIRVSRVVALPCDFDNPGQVMEWAYTIEDKNHRRFGLQFDEKDCPQVKMGYSEKLPNLEVDILACWSSSDSVGSPVRSWLPIKSKKPLPAFTNFLQQVSVSVPLGQIDGDCWAEGLTVAAKVDQPLTQEDQHCVAKGKLPVKYKPESTLAHMEVGLAYALHGTVKLGKPSRPQRNILAIQQPPLPLFRQPQEANAQTLTTPDQVENITNMPDNTGSPCDNCPILDSLQPSHTCLPSTLHSSPRIPTSGSNEELASMQPIPRSILMQNASGTYPTASSSSSLPLCSEATIAQHATAHSSSSMMSRLKRSSWAWYQPWFGKVGK